MALPIGAVAPDFEAETTDGKIKFHDWIGNSWAMLFSHPKDFTPVCTTELGALAKLKPEFDKRGVKLMGLSVDPVDRHSKWAEDIKETQGAAPNYPMIGDTDYNVSKLYDMLPADVEGDPTKRTPAENQTVRNVFVIGPDKKMLGVPAGGEGSHLLPERVHITPATPYTFQDEFPCRLNEMRLNHGTSDWRHRP